MQLKLDDLDHHLARGVQALYVVHGDEPLLALEAGDAIRAAARAAGAVEREVLVVEPGFRWDAFLGANANASLFGERKLVDLRIPSGKPGVEGGKALEAYAARPNPDNVTLVTLPRLDRADAVVRVVQRPGPSRRYGRGLSGRARRAAGLDRRTARAPEAAGIARDAHLPGRELRRQPARRAAGDREARAAAAAGRPRAPRPSRARWPTSPATTSSSCRKRGSPATRRARCACCARSRARARR